MRRRAIQVICLCSVVFLSPATSVQAAQFAGGTGTAADPYQIATAEQLISIGSDPNLLDKHFVLINDIDLDPNLSPAYAFDQAVISSFSGVFNGNGCHVHRLTVRGPYGYGLFAVVGYGAEVKNLILEDVDISGESSSIGIGAGALCGLNEGVILRCHVTGTVSGRGMAGGLVGRNYGVVEECGSVCTVSAEGSGGLVGVDDGSIRDCYALGHVSGESAGGLLANISRGSISRCYAAGWIHAIGSNSGGLAGYADSPLQVRDSYFLAPCDGGGPDNGFGTPLTSEQMTQASSFAGWEFWGTTRDSFRMPWYMPEGDYPQLAWYALAAIPKVRGLAIEEASRAMADAGVEVRDIICDYDDTTEYGCAILARPYAGALPGEAVGIVVSLGPYEWSLNPGTGEPNDPYQILTPGQLDSLTQQPQLWDKHFRLISDLDMTSRVYNRALLGATNDVGMPFAGTLDGNGHVITNLTIEGVSARDDRPELLGLFGELTPSASIKDLGLRGVSILGRGYHQEIGGMLCGVNGGSIERCYCQGELRGYGRLGGLVGSNAGAINDCYAMGEIEDLSLRDTHGSYAGLVAENTFGTISTCYAACVVPEYGGGLVEHNENDSVKHCLWDVEVSGVDYSAGGKGVSTAALMSVWTLQDSGWGGNPNWVIDDRKDYPRLIWEGTPGDPIPPATDHRR